MEGDARPKLLRRGCLPAAGGSQDGRRCAGDMIGGALPLRNPEGAAEGTQAAPRCIAAIPGRPARQLHQGICNIQDASHLAEFSRGNSERHCSGLLGRARFTRISVRSVHTLLHSLSVAASAEITLTRQSSVSTNSQRQP